MSGFCVRSAPTRSQAFTNFPNSHCFSPFWNGQLNWSMDLEARRNGKDSVHSEENWRGNTKDSYSCYCCGETLHWENRLTTNT